MVSKRTEEALAEQNAVASNFLSKLGSWLPRKPRHYGTADIKMVEEVVANLECGRKRTF